MIHSISHQSNNRFSRRRSSVPEIPALNPENWARLSVQFKSQVEQVATVQSPTIPFWKTNRRNGLRVRFLHDQEALSLHAFLFDVYNFGKYLRVFGQTESKKSSVFARSFLTYPIIFDFTSVKFSSDTFVLFYFCFTSFYLFFSHFMTIIRIYDFFQICHHWNIFCWKFRIMNILWTEKTRQWTINSGLEKIYENRNFLYFKWTYSSEIKSL